MPVVIGLFKVGWRIHALNHAKFGIVKYPLCKYDPPIMLIMQCNANVIL